MRQEDRRQSTSGNDPGVITQFSTQLLIQPINHRYPAEHQARLNTGFGGSAYHTWGEFELNGWQFR